MEAKRNENAKKENVNSNDKCNSGSKKKRKYWGVWLTHRRLLRA